MKDKNEKNGIVTLLLMTAAACFIYMMNSGIRNNFGIMLQAITENTGLTFASVSFVLAIAQLSFGITQPISGVIAEKRGSRFSLIVGIVCLVIGAGLTPKSKTKV